MNYVIDVFQLHVIDIKMYKILHTNINNVIIVHSRTIYILYDWFIMKSNIEWSYLTFMLLLLIDQPTLPADIGDSQEQEMGNNSKKLSSTKNMDLILRYDFKITIVSFFNLWRQAFAQDLSCLSLWQVKILNDGCHLQWQVNTNSHLSFFWQNIFVLYQWKLLHVCIYTI